MVNDPLKRCMAPAGSDDALLLVLGSLPGDASLAAQRYYAHPTNQFWRLLGDAIGEPLADRDYDERLDLLTAHRIALWDVVGAARRPGSLDGRIRSVVANPLLDLVARHPHLRAIGFNGRLAAARGRRVLGTVTGQTLIDLPSSSAAMTKAIAAKAVDWRVLGEFAGLHAAQKAAD